MLTLFQPDSTTSDGAGQGDLTPILFRLEDGTLRLWLQRDSDKADIGPRLTIEPQAIAAGHHRRPEIFDLASSSNWSSSFSAFTANTVRSGAPPGCAPFCARVRVTGGRSPGPSVVAIVTAPSAWAAGSHISSWLIGTFGGSREPAFRDGNLVWGRVAPRHPSVLPRARRRHRGSQTR
jgi:hypothetical protein